MFPFIPPVLVLILSVISNPLVHARGSYSNAAPNVTNLSINVLVGVNGLSTFQCWSVEPPLIISSQIGIAGAKVQLLGDMTGGNVLFFNETAVTHAGLHHPPAPQWVMILEGRALVTLPSTNATMSLPAGQFIIANDTVDVSDIGHDTTWDAGSVAVQLPFAGGLIPNHTVLNFDGLCTDYMSHIPYHTANSSISGPSTN